MRALTARMRAFPVGVSMRTQSEVREMLNIYRDHNDAIAEQVSRTSSDEIDGLCSVFNSNAQIICALQWVMGEDTIRVVKS